MRSRHIRRAAGARVLRAIVLAFAAVWITSPGIDIKTFTACSSRRSKEAVVPCLQPHGIQGDALRWRTARWCWNEDVAFHVATVTSNVEVAEGIHLIALDAPPEVLDSYQNPGQFVQARGRLKDNPAFFAIASPPGSGPLEFLVKEVESSAWLTNTQRGGAAELSGALGKGFNISCQAWASADVNQVNLFATGTGVAPIRAVVNSGALSGKVCRLYLGAQTEAALVVDSEWKRQGLQVVPVLSRADGSWRGRHGYVQDVFREDEERGEGFVLSPRHGALLCGQREMVAAVREVYIELGVPEERTLLNL